MPNKHLETSIEIAASPQRVWRELTTFSKYPEWSRFIVSVAGEPRVGQRLTVKLDQGSGRPMIIKPELLTVRENEELCWEGKLGSSFIFAGQHYFRLTPQPDGYTRLTHGERFRGLLLPALWRSLDTTTRAAFERFNEAIRERAESTISTPRGA